jgi:hypothetical protein
LYNADRTWLTILLLAALGLRSLVADGYMPDEQGAVTLCTPEGMVSVVIDPDTGEPVEVEASLTGECPWAHAFFPGALLASAPSLPAHHPAVRSTQDPVRSPTSHASAGLPHVRAPPALPC